MHWSGLYVGAMRRLRVCYWSGGSMRRGLTAGMEECWLVQPSLARRRSFDCCWSGVNILPGPTASKEGHW